MAARAGVGSRSGRCQGFRTLAREAGRGGPLEALEERCLLSTVYNFDLHGPAAAPSDVAGGVYDFNNAGTVLARGAPAAGSPLLQLAANGTRTTLPTTSVLLASNRGEPQMDDAGTTVAAGQVLGLAGELVVWRGGAVQYVLYGDTLAPTRTIQTTGHGFATPAEYRLTIDYQDAGGLNVATTDAAVTVASPAGGAMDVRVAQTLTDNLPDPRWIRVVYAITKPGGSAWTDADNGSYPITVRGGVVLDRAGNRLGTPGENPVAATLTVTLNSTGGGGRVYAPLAAPPAGARPDVAVRPVRAKLDGYFALTDGGLIFASGTDVLPDGTDGPRSFRVFPAGAGQWTASMTIPASPIPLGNGYAVKATDNFRVVEHDAGSGTFGDLWVSGPNQSTALPLVPTDRFSVRGFDVSGDGSVIVFDGTLANDADGWSGLHRGGGIFAAVQTGGTDGGWTYVRVVDGDRNGYLGDGESWDDHDRDGRFDQGVVTSGNVSTPQGTFPVSGYEDAGFKPYVGGLAVADVYDVANAYDVVFRADESRGRAFSNVFTARLVTDGGDPRAATPRPLFYEPYSRPDPGSRLTMVTVDGRSLNLEALATNALLVNDRGQFAFDAPDAGGSRVVLATAVARRPVLLFHGVAASGVGQADYDAWLMNLGFDPLKLEDDPAQHSYRDIIQTLRNAGYKPGVDLFIANYDWRLALAPTSETNTDGGNDGNADLDGVITGVTGPSITDGSREYGIDYVGYWLKRAADQWRHDHPSAPPLDRVDVITHSMGGLLARSYVQSTAYGQPDVAGNPLPKVAELVTLAMPSRGASKSWNFTQDDWGADFKAYFLFMSRIAGAAFNAVADRGHVVYRDGKPYITRQILTRNFSQPADVRLFIEMYAPTARGLLATYPFLTEHLSGMPPRSVNADRAARNLLVLDLNAGLDVLHSRTGHYDRLEAAMADPRVLDPNQYARLTRATALYGDSDPTLSYVVARTGPALDFTLTTIADLIPSPPGFGTVYYQDRFDAAGGPDGRGDQTVPRWSARGQFSGELGVQLRGFQQQPLIDEPGIVRTLPGAVEHSLLPSNVDVQAAVLAQLGYRPPRASISTGKVITDPFVGARPAATFVFPGLTAAVVKLVDAVSGLELWRRGGGGAGGSAPFTEFGGPGGSGFALSAAPLTGPLRLAITGDGAPVVIDVARTLPDGRVARLYVHQTIPAGVTVEYDLPEPTAPASVADAVFRDANGNGARDPGETGFAGVTVFDDLDNDGAFDSFEPHTVTGPTGAFLIGGLPAGAHRLAVVTPTAWRPTLPAGGARTVTLAAGANQAGGAAFGLTLSPASPADANLDGAVNFDDLVPLAQNYNVTDGRRTWRDGDYSGDGNVDFNDLVILAQNYNTTRAPAPPTAAGHEPFAAALARAGVPQPAAPTPPPARKPPPKPAPPTRPPAKRAAPKATTPTPPVRPTTPFATKKIHPARLTSGLLS